MKQSALDFIVEQLSKEHPIYTKNDIINQAKEMQKQQQDEFAIGFVKWVVSPETSDLLHDLEIVGEIDEDITPEQLLEIYKKEKGL